MNLFWHCNEVQQIGGSSRQAIRTVELAKLIENYEPVEGVPQVSWACLSFRDDVCCLPQSTILVHLVRKYPIILAEIFISLLLNQAV